MKHKRLAAAVLAAALLADRLRRRGGSALPPQAPAQLPKAPQTRRCRRHKKTASRSSSRWKKPSGTSERQRTEADHPCAAACVRQPGCCNISMMNLPPGMRRNIRDYESYPQAEVSQDEWCPQTYIDWDAYWYGDCVSLVVRSYYGGTDPIYSQGWCFDFAAGHKLSVTELLHAHGTGPGRDAACSVPRCHTDF